MHTAITTGPIDGAALVQFVRHDGDGAVLLFLGVVRDRNDGRSVTGMEYEAYVEMAEAVLARIAEEASARLGTAHIAVEHRVGELTVGEPSVGIAVASPHRQSAYDASRMIIEEIKKRLPVWKLEHYTDGERAWVPGHTPTLSAAGDPS